MTVQASTRDSWLWILLGASTLAFVFSCARPVRPDDMSALAHRQVAARDYYAAAAERKQYDPDARATAHGAAPLDPIATYNPTQLHLRRAASLAAHAREHEAAAAELEAFEDAECGGFSIGVRAACPVLGPIASVEDLADGVRLHLAEGAPVLAVAAHMRCHFAYARARGFERVADCPLYVKGIEIRPTSDGRAIDLTSADDAAVRELRRRAHEL
jgi:hypothetical protein